MQKLQIILAHQVEKTILRDISFVLEPGEMTVVLGGMWAYFFLPQTCN